MPDELSVTPEIDAIEEQLVMNHDQFMELTNAWTRAWQRKLAAERKRKQRERAQQNSLPADNEKAA